MSDLIHHRQKSPWLWPNLLYNAFGEGRQHYMNLKILHSFTNKVSCLFMSQLVGLFLSCFCSHASFRFVFEIHLSIRPVGGGLVSSWWEALHHGVYMILLPERGSSLICVTSGISLAAWPIAMPTALWGNSETSQKLCKAKQSSTFALENNEWVRSLAWENSFEGMPSLNLYQWNSNQYLKPFIWFIVFFPVTSVKQLFKMYFLLIEAKGLRNLDQIIKCLFESRTSWTNSLSI